MASILGRSFSVALKLGARAELFLLAQAARRDGIDFKVALVEFGLRSKGARRFRSPIHASTFRARRSKRIACRFSAIAFMTNVHVLRYPALRRMDTRGGPRRQKSWKESVMKCSNPDCNRGIGLIAYQRGWFSNRRYCSRHCRNAFVADAPKLQPKRDRPIEFGLRSKGTRHFQSPIHAGTFRARRSKGIACRFSAIADNVCRIGPQSADGSYGRISKTRAFGFEGNPPNR